jgi:hypothetical protein
MRKILLALAAVLLATAALAQSAVTVLDQNPAPAPTQTVNPELMTQSINVTGGTLYVSTLAQSRANGGNGQPQAVASTFVPVAAGGLTRYLPLVHFKADSGITLPAASSHLSATSGLFAIDRTAGTSLQLVGETSGGSGGNVTDAAIFDFVLPDTYVAGANIAFVINGYVTGTGTNTTAATTLTVAAYKEVNGVETALTVAYNAATCTGSGAACQIAKAVSGSNYGYTLTGTGLTPGAHVVLELTGLVTSTVSGLSMVLNSVSFGA